MLYKLIAKEGHKTILVFLGLFIIFSIIDCDFFGFIFFALTLWFIFIYRNKKIKKDYDENDLISPISGKITSIDKRDNKKIIHVEVSLFDNHTIRAIKTGNFTVKVLKGVNVLLNSFKAKKLNQKFVINYEDIKLEFINSLFSNDSNIKSGFALKGDILGVFLQGQVVIELDDEKELLVNIGNKLQSGKTVLARIK